MRRALLILGLLVLAVVWLGPLPQLARHAFFAHMTMHMGVVAMAAPLRMRSTSRRSTWCGSSSRVRRTPPSR